MRCTLTPLVVAFLVTLSEGIVADHLTVPVRTRMVMGSLSKARPRQLTSYPFPPGGLVGSDVDVMGREVEAEHLDPNLPRSR